MLGCKAGVLMWVIVQRVSLRGAVDTAGLHGGAECLVDTPQGASWACRSPSPLRCSRQLLILHRACKP